MDKRMRIHTTYLGLTVLLLVASVAGWASLVPPQLSVKPTVTINQAASQADPAYTMPIHFTVVFSKVVKDFSAGDVTLTGTAPGPKTKTVTGSGRIYDVAVRGMTGTGTVIANLAAGVAHDAVGNASKASTSTDNTVTYRVIDVTPPTVTINQAPLPQTDPTSTLPIHFTVVFSEVVTDFATGDVTLTGTASGRTQTVTPVSGTTYDVAVNVTGPGTVIANLAAGVAHNAAGNASTAATFTDNTVTYRVIDVTRPTVTIKQAVDQADPTNESPIHFTVVFSKAVTDFAAGDVTLSGTAPGASVEPVAGSGRTYDVYVSGMTDSGTVTASLAAGVAQDAVGNLNEASTTGSTDSTDNQVTYDVTAPTVTIKQAVGQDDPTNESPIHFTVVFSKVVTGLDSGDITLATGPGTAPGASVDPVNGTGRTYDVYVRGMTDSGTVTASLAAGVAQDAVGNASTASTTGSTDSTDNQVTYDVTAPTVTIKQAVDQDDPTSTLPIRFTVVFSERVTGFAAGDVTLSGTASGAVVSGVTGSGTTYYVDVRGMTSPGTVTARLEAGVAQDAVGNLNEASTTGLPPDDDNTVTYIYYVAPFVPLGTAATFGAFGSFAGMTNTGVYTIIYGDIGTTAACAEVKGFYDSTGDEYSLTPLNVGDVKGRIYAYPPPAANPLGPAVGGNAFTKAMADAALANATIAYNYLKDLPITDPDPTASQAIAGDLGGLTVAPGIYKAAPQESFCIMPGETLTLDALGDPNAVWVFQMGTSLTVGTAGFGGTPAKVVFKDNVGQPKNVYWQVGTAAYINTGAVMVGTIIAGTTVTFSTAGSADPPIMTTLDGRALALTESVTMVNTIIRVPSP